MVTAPSNYKLLKGFYQDSLTLPIWMPVGRGGERQGAGRKEILAGFFRDSWLHLSQKANGCKSRDKLTLAAMSGWAGNAEEGDGREWGWGRGGGLVK